MKFSQSHFTSHSKHITLEKGKLIKPLHLNTFLCVYGRQRGGCCTHASVIDSQFRLTSSLSLPFLSFCLCSFALFLSHLLPCVPILSLSVYPLLCRPVLLSSSWGDPCSLTAWEKNISKTVCLCLPL